MGKNKGRVENLRTLTPEEARIQGRKGGLKSAENRRKKRAAQETLKNLLFTDIPEDYKAALESLTGKIDPEDDSLYTAVIAVQIKEALKGSTRAAEFLRSIMNEIEPPASAASQEDDTLSAALKELANRL